MGWWGSHFAQRFLMTRGFILVILVIFISFLSSLIHVSLNDMPDMSISHIKVCIVISLIFVFNIVAPGQVLNLTVQKKGNDYKSAYVSWSPPAVRDHNSALQSYLFLSNHTGVSFSIKRQVHILTDSEIYNSPFC